MPDTSPLLLVASLRQGDENALAELVRLYGELLRRVAGRMVGRRLRPHLDCDDLLQSVQQTLLVGLRAGKFDIPDLEHFLGLALALVRRNVAQQWRQLRRQPAIVAGTSGAAALASCTSKQEDPAQHFQNAAEIENMLAGMEFTDRRLVELRLEGYSTAEVARSTGLDAGYLRVRLVRLRRRLARRGFLKRANARERPTLVTQEDGVKHATTPEAGATLADVSLSKTWGDVRAVDERESADG